MIVRISTVPTVARSIAKGSTPSILQWILLIALRSAHVPTTAPRTSYSASCCSARDTASQCSPSYRTPSATQTLWWKCSCTRASWMFPCTTECCYSSRPFGKIVLVQEGKPPPFALVLVEGRSHAVLVLWPSKHVDVELHRLLFYASYAVPFSHEYSGRRLLN